MGFVKITRPILPTAMLPKSGLTSIAAAPLRVAALRLSAGVMRRRMHAKLTTKGIDTEGDVPGLKSVAKATVAPESINCLAGGVYGSFDLGNLLDGGPTPADYAASKLIAARYPTGALPAMSNTALRDLRNLGRGREKVNSLMPEEVNVANLTAVVEECLRKARDTLTNKNVPGMIAEIATWPDGFWEISVQFDFPPLRTINGVAP